MSKSVALAIVLFAAGVLVGRLSVFLTESQGHTPTTTPLATPSATELKPGGLLRGRIAEVIQVPKYTYVRLESGEWAAVESAPALAVGQSVSVVLDNEMVDFSSPSLGRTFARLWFGALEGATPTPTGVKAALAAVEATNALTLRVADVHGERASLSGQRVRVKGTVDRDNFVQGVHYVHLKDGSGSAADKTDDLLCISSVEIPKGTAVTLEGVVAVDKNVGMGINPVVLEDAVAR